jgi:hypothetical protein
MSWAEMEFSNLDLGDKRIKTRAVKLLKTLAKSPKSSIPQACQGWAETQATYRFYSNESVTWEKLLTAHTDQVEQRIIKSEEAVILCLQDTTELDFNGQETEGLGRLSYDVQRGMYLHPTLCMTPDRIPLGISDAWMWSRGESKAKDLETPTIKESDRWVEGYERVAEMAERCPQSRLVYVADREGDMLSLMAKSQALNTPADWLVRARHNRKLSTEEKLWDRVDKQKVMSRISFIKPRRKGEKSRQVQQEIKVLRCTFPHKGKEGIEVTLVQAKEMNPPKGKSPLVWRLLSNRLVENEAQARELIDWYRCRWEIEMFFDVLKIGCKVEKLQLAKKERIEKALVMAMIITWRVMYLMRLGRVCPDLPAELIFDPLEWKSSYVLLEKTIPKKAPTLNTVLRNLATLGGFLGRKSEGDPGAKSIWVGFQRIQDCVFGAQMARKLEELD